MNETLNKIASTVKAELDKGGMGSFTVEARITGGRDTADFADSTPEKKRDITLLIKSENPAAELTPTPYEEYIASTLAKLTPLTPYFEFKKPEKSEPEKDHLHHLREKFDAVIGKAFAAGITGSFKNYSDWFEERAKLEALKETADENVHTQRGYANNVSRNDNFVSDSFMVPSGVNADEVQKSIESRKDGILSLLGRMVAKKLKFAKGSPEETAIIAKMKTFDMVVTTQSYGSGYSNVNIEFRSPEVTAAMKEPGGLGALSADKQKELKASNPLMQLKDGDGLTPENPADLQKAVSRAILYEGVNGEKPIELFKKLAGPLDERRGIEKTLNYIKAAIKDTKPEMVADIDVILKDPLFEDRSNWFRPKKDKDGKPEKAPITVYKTDERGPDNKHVEGQFRVELSIPEKDNQLQKVENELAALAAAPAAAPTTTIGSITKDAIAEVNAAVAEVKAAIAEVNAAAPAPAESWGAQVGGPKPPATVQPQAGNWLDRNVIKPVAGALGL